MHDWKRKVNNKNKKASSTPGREKVDTCQADWLKKYFAKNSRSYRSQGYEEHLKWAKKVNQVSGKQ